MGGMVRSMQCAAMPDDTFARDVMTRAFRHGKGDAVNSGCVSSHLDVTAIVTASAFAVALFAVPCVQAGAQGACSTQGAGVQCCGASCTHTGVQRTQRTQRTQRDIPGPHRSYGYRAEVPIPLPVVALLPPFDPQFSVPFTLATWPGDRLSSGAPAPSLNASPPDERGNGMHVNFLWLSV